MVRVEVTIRNPARTRKEWRGLFLVDTGATHTAVPRECVRAIGLKPSGTSTYELADGRHIEKDTGTAQIEFMGGSVTCTVSFGGAGVEPLLGLDALAAMGVEVDPARQELRPSSDPGGVLTARESAVANKRARRSRRDGKPWRRSSSRPRRMVAAPFRLLRFLAMIVLPIVAPFFLLIRGAVFAHQEWALGGWQALLASAAATMLVVQLYAWLASRRTEARKRLRKAFVRLGAFVSVAYVAYALTYFGSVHAKSPEVRTVYQQLHPVLRAAASVVVLTAPASVVTDAGPTPADGFVHALHLRTAGRPEWRRRTVELAFRALGFHAQRGVDAEDHLHISLRLPEEVR